VATRDIARITDSEKIDVRCEVRGIAQGIFNSVPTRGSEFLFCITARFASKIASTFEPLPKYFTEIL
jgi:hypothetical protein